MLITRLLHQLELDAGESASLVADYERFAAGLPQSPEDYIHERYHLNLSSEYGGLPIKNPFGKGIRSQETFREIYWRVYVKHETGWEGNPAKLGRATCLAGSDCTSKVCKNGMCQAPMCTDGVQNGDETDVDCGGRACPACSPAR